MNYKRMARKSLCIAAGMVGVFLLIVAIANISRQGGSQDRELAETQGLGSPTRHIVKRPSPSYGSRGISVKKPETSAPSNDTGGLLKPPLHTNFLFIGLDNNALADAIMVGSFHRDTGDIHLMSVPRDTRVSLPQHRLEAMEAQGLHPPTVLKMNAIRAYGGRQHGVQHLQAHLQEFLGVPLHYYVEVDLGAFRRIVDALGGVTVTLPQALYYQDPEQNLSINLPAGTQHLDGDMAEKLVRFRSFPTGDLMRNHMQMEFMQQLIGQLLTREAIMREPLTLLNIILNDVRTNASVLEMTKYLPYASRMGNVTTFTMPGAAAYVDGISWFVPDEDLLNTLVPTIFHLPGQ